jgi:DNA-binding LacI/PurR family transcriptional regulator
MNIKQLRQLAKKAGTSPGQVLRALSSHPDVPSYERGRVWRALGAHGSVRLGARRESRHGSGKAGRRQAA